MPDLYRLSVGPIHAAYYQHHFQRFERLGRTLPTWNHGAAFGTLAWLLLRKMWRPAGIYAAILGTLLALWWLGIHGRIALPMEAAVCMLAMLLMCIVPGFMGNGLYYHHVRNRTLKTLTAATSIAQARVLLAAQAPTKERLHITITVQSLVAVAVLAAVGYQLKGATSQRTPTALSGPPDIVIPSVQSVRALQPEAFTPDKALPLPVAAEVVMSDAAPRSVATAAALEEAAALPEHTLSTVALAQSVPRAAANAAPASAVTEAAPTPLTPSKKAVTAAPAVKAPPAPAARAAPAPAGRLLAGKYYLHAGVYAQAANVNQAVQSLHKAKLPTVRQTVHSAQGELTRLRIGPFDTRRQAEQAATKAKQLRIKTTVFQQPKQ